jgi:hypothetical protein
MLFLSKKQGQDMNQKEVEELQNGLITGSIDVFEVINEKNILECDRIAIIVDDQILSQECLRQFASRTAKLFLERENKTYKLVSQSVRELMQTLTTYEDDESVAWEILEKQEGVIVASKIYTPEIATGIAHIAIRLYTTYMGIENWYEFDNYANDDKATQNRDFFFDEAYRELLAILLDCILVNRN